MWVLAILMFFSLLVAIVFLAAFIWAVRSGQYDDKYTPALRILLDDEVSDEEEGSRKEVVRSR
ncbi:MAG: cbb3-type cytochrome oxidase assembly protein CcoS [Ignavibacteria bacterium]|jgi:cbb3-type cytochrome oxidase maturation protein|nr:cbb3-type cytochrome oxidase assembly protein CcoS [Ignavibacteria bacterium]MCU7503576.1 cbb3-type cytochrome oxidase assembly protein CcoS [Ignavibacteria bacterium]MCU7516770.1 cbb3-type cytochrome oxidase assembly protein CcoS [Ignavibacteria bacterium]